MTAPDTEPKADPEDAYAGPAIVEIFGHQLVAGFVREVFQYGGASMRVDVPNPAGDIVVTQFYGANAIFRLTPCSETAVHAALKQKYSLPPPVRLALAGPEEQQLLLGHASDDQRVHEHPLVD